MKSKREERTVELEEGRRSKAIDSLAVSSARARDSTREAEEVRRSRSVSRREVASEDVQEEDGEGGGVWEERMREESRGMALEGMAALKASLSEGTESVSDGTREEADEPSSMRSSIMLITHPTIVPPIWISAFLTSPSTPPFH